MNGFFEQHELNWFERFCSVFERLKFPVPEDLEKSYAEAIRFIDLNVTPSSVFAASVFVFTISLLVFSFTFYLISGLSLSTFLLALTFSAILFWLFLQYPFTYATNYRIKSTSEMVLAVLYMAIGMKVVPNLEYAVKFAAENIEGPLAKDLKKVLWSVYNGIYTRVSDALDWLTEKWKHESEEFCDAINIIKNATFSTFVEREKALNEAIQAVLEGTEERMRRYAKSLKTPLALINTVGILMPILGLVFFPLMSIFLPEVLQPFSVIVGYNVLLPFFVYVLMNNFLEKRPYAFHQPRVEEHPKFRKRNLLVLVLASLVSFIFFTSIYFLFTAEDKMTYSLLAVATLTFGSAGVLFLESYEKSKLREEIIEIERELGVALFQLGMQLKRGMPIENAIKAALPRMKNFKIKKLFEKIAYNMEMGMDFHSAVFDKQNGALVEFPSKMIEATMRALVEIAKSGNLLLAEAMITIAGYLKSVHKVEEDLKDEMTEITASMSLQAIMLAPLTAGITVALVGVVVDLLKFFAGMLKSFQQITSGYGPVGSVSIGPLERFSNVSQLLPTEFFQLTVGIYVVEIVVLTVIFTNIVDTGGDKVARNSLLAKSLGIAGAVYLIVLLVVNSLLAGMLPMLTGGLA